nr:MAG TPA: hypothetical protein [Caudoviricetes sp.]
MFIKIGYIVNAIYPKLFCILLNFYLLILNQYCKSIYRLPC